MWTASENWTSLAVFRRQRRCFIFTGLCFVAATNTASEKPKWPPRKMVFVAVPWWLTRCSTYVVHICTGLASLVLDRLWSTRPLGIWERCVLWTYDQSDACTYGKRDWAMQSGLRCSWCGRGDELPRARCTLLRGSGSRRQTYGDRRVERLACFATTEQASYTPSNLLLLQSRAGYSAGESWARVHAEAACATRT